MIGFAGIRIYHAEARQHFGRRTADQWQMSLAVKAYSEALGVFKSPEHLRVRGSVLIGLAQALSGYASLAHKSAEAQLALQLLEQASEIFQVSTDPALWAQIQMDSGTTLVTWSTFAPPDKAGGLLERALTHFDAALDISSPETNSTSWIQLQMNKGTALRLLGEAQESPTLIRQSLACYGSAREVIGNDTSSLLLSHVNVLHSQAIAALSALDGDDTLSQSAFDERRAAFAALTPDGHLQTFVSLARDLACECIKRQEWTNAEYYLSQAISATDEAIIRAEQSESGRVEVIRLSKRLHSLLSYCLVEKEDLRAAVTIAEAGHARMSKDSLVFNVEKLKRLEGNALEDLASARTRCEDLRHKMGLLSSADCLPQTWLPSATIWFRQGQGLKLANKEHESMILRLFDEKYFGVCLRYGLIAHRRPLEYEDILNSCPRGGAIIIPVVTEFKAFSLIITKDKQPEIVFWQCALDELTAQLAGQSDSWFPVCWRTVDLPGFSRERGSDTRYDRWNTMLSLKQTWLWDRVMGPLHERLSKELAAGARVVIIASGSFGPLPLHAAGPDQDSRYFLDHWTTVISPSARRLQETGGGAQASELPPSLLAIVDPSSNLPGARQEALTLENYFKGSNHHVVAGRKATLDSIHTHLRSTEVTYIHCSTHGFHIPEEADRSYLELANDERLSLPVLASLNCKSVRLAFLSACDSAAAGFIDLPDEFVGLPNSFLEAGARDVICSLWKVFDDTSFLLSLKFYDQYLDHKGKERTDPATALRSAVSWLRGVTFGDLKKEFPLYVGLDNREYLAMSARLWRSDSVVSVGGHEDSETPFDIPLMVALGPEEERPYAGPHEWAAFVTFGV